MSKLMAAVALCATTMTAFATAAGASGDYPPDDTDSGTDDICLADDENTDSGGGSTGGGPDGEVAGETGTSNPPHTGDPAIGGSDADDPGCTGETPADTGDPNEDSEEAAVGIASQGANRAAADAGGGELPTTGTDTSMIVRLGAMSVIAGGALVVVAWWRKRPAPA